MITTKLANQIAAALKVLTPQGKAFDRNGDRHECISDGLSQVKVNRSIDTEISLQALATGEQLQKQRRPQEIVGEFES